MGEAKLRAEANGTKRPPPRPREKDQKPEAAQLEGDAVPVNDLINAMVGELTEQNNELRSRTVRYRAEIAKLNAIIVARDLTIRKLSGEKAN